METLQHNTIHHGDCFELMRLIPDGSVDAVITDPPYNTTNCKWDVAIDLETLFKEFERVIKPNGAVVVFCSFKFGVDCVNVCKGKLKFRYDLVWEKSKTVGYFDANNRQLRNHENILLFSINEMREMVYNPQMTYGNPYIDKRTNRADESYTETIRTETVNNGLYYPTSIIKGRNPDNGLHPTQKPVSLLEYLVATYSNESDLILDPFLGSGTTAVACRNLKRQYIGFELDKEYYDICVKRLNEPLQERMF